MRSLNVMSTKAKVVSIVGARPQFIKLAPLSRSLGRVSEHIIVHTGQHYDFNMSDIFFKHLKIPRVHVNLRIGGQSHGSMTGMMLLALEAYLVKVRPALVLVYGDTNTTLAGALAAAKLAIPVGHIEAGMRSFVSNMPEEINRRLTDHLATLLFCCTTTAKRNLAREGIKKNLILSGDLMYELLADTQKIIGANRRFLKKHGLKEKDYIYLTAHRAANVDRKENLVALMSIIEAQDGPVIFPVHPRTAARLKRYGLAGKFYRLKNLVAIEPLGYLDNLTAAKFARAVLTDSGGLQKEALFLGTPVLTLRKETEWVETLKKGNHLVELDGEKIDRLLKRKLRVKKINYIINGRKPSDVIVAAIGKFLKTLKRTGSSVAG